MYNYRIYGYVETFKNCETKTSIKALVSVLTGLTEDLKIVCRYSHNKHNPQLKCLDIYRKGSKAILYRIDLLNKIKYTYYRGNIVNTFNYDL